MGKFDIFWVKFNFEDNPNDFKIRPALMLGDGKFLEVGAKITKHPPRTQNDYELKDWSIEGLRAPSTVRLDKIQKVTPLDRIGHLSDRDQEEIEKILNK